jgi:hypothetical protein
MTVHRRLILDVRDLQTIRVVCSQCGGAVTAPATAPFNFPSACPSCRTTWADVMRPERTQSLLTIIQAVQRHRQLEADGARLPCTLQFELDCPALPAPSESPR